MAIIGSAYSFFIEPSHFNSSSLLFIISSLLIKKKNQKIQQSIKYLKHWSLTKSQYNKNSKFI